MNTLFFVQKLSSNGIHCFLFPCQKGGSRQLTWCSEKNESDDESFKRALSVLKKRRIVFMAPEETQQIVPLFQ